MYSLLLPILLLPIMVLPIDLKGFLCKLYSRSFKFIQIILSTTENHNLPTSSQCFFALLDW